jgi:hypothetical protein
MIPLFVAGVMGASSVLLLRCSGCGFAERRPHGQKDARRHLS